MGSGPLCQILPTRMWPKHLRARSKWGNFQGRGPRKQARVLVPALKAQAVGSTQVAGLLCQLYWRGSDEGWLSTRAQPLLRPRREELIVAGTPEMAACCPQGDSQDSGEVSPSQFLLEFKTKAAVPSSEEFPDLTLLTGTHKKALCSSSEGGAQQAWESPCGGRCSWPGSAGLWSWNLGPAACCGSASTAVGPLHTCSTSFT